jgi:hypothetical protein
MLVRILLSVAFVSTASSQTFIVDAANGPGTNFTDIATATATVPDGAVLLVRAGSYPSFNIANKGLAVLGASGVSVAGRPPITITGTSVQQRIELRGLQIDDGELSLNSCQGAVLLYNCTVGGLSNIGTLRASTCQQVHADGCAFGTPGQGPPAVVLVGSSAAFRNCSAMSVLSPPCDVQSSSLQLTDCNATAIFSTSSAIQLTNGDVRVIGGSLSTVFAPCINGSGIARVDPSVSAFPGLPAFVTVVEMPAVVSTGGALGGTLTVSMRGPGGQVGGLLAGLPGAPYLLPGIRDAIWLRAGTETVSFFAAFVTGVPVQTTTSVPNTGALRGLRVAWQGFTYGASSGLQASTPAITSHW